MGGRLYAITRDRVLRWMQVRTVAGGGPFEGTTRVAMKGIEMA